VKPVESAQQSLLDFDLGESSDDSDFRIEDHCEESDDDSVDSNDVGKGTCNTLYCNTHLNAGKRKYKYKLNLSVRIMYLYCLYCKIVSKYETV